MNPATGHFKHYRQRDGMPNDVVYGILEDSQGRLWLSTNWGLSCFDPMAEIFFNYDISDGLQDYEFNTAACYKNPRTGEMLFGGVNGFNVFHPDSIEQDTFLPPSVISSLTRFKEGKAQVNHFLSDKKTMEFSYGEKILTFEFAALSFRKTSKIRYKYQLKGFSDEWYDMGTKREVTFTNLSPGDYIFKVLSTNSDGLWNSKPTALNITILPPWYRTWVAYIIYATLFIWAVYAYYSFQKRRWQLQTQLQLEQAEAARLKELSIAKNRLYTNITHEFRTPLSIIGGMASQIKENPKKWLQEGMDMIMRNTDQLLQLVNQMLDLRKLESGVMQTNMVQGDVIIYLKYLVESFHSLAEAKNINLSFHSDMEQLFMDYDPDKLQQIVANLLSNALKFTKEGGKVSLGVMIQHPDSKELLLKFTDSGIGIAKEKLTYIFDRFYQIDNSDSRKAEGTGIGLALTKELVKLMGGEITVESAVGKGSEFTIALPINNLAPLVKQQPISPIIDAVPVFEETKVTFAKKNNLPLVLIIEDNADVVQYLKACLATDYQMAVATNGRKGVEMAIESIPDLIISDVMMPEMDGFEVCQNLKVDERTSHVPIILLTAKADVESKLKGLERGADAYLAKPFHKKELLVRVKKLLELRQKLQQHYRSLAFSQSVDVSAKKEGHIKASENEFVQKVRDIIEAHLEDTEFDMPHLCREVGMSRSQLHRKLTALTDLSPTRFIRHVRLAKAKSLLLETEETVAVVAYETGFTDPNYFTRVFTKEIGVSPSRFREQE